MMDIGMALLGKFAFWSSARSYTKLGVALESESETNPQGKSPVNKKTK
jgi:hypothetical protein